MGNIRVYSDGFCASSPNGAAAWAFIVYKGEKVIYSDKGLVPDKRISSSVAEYTALEKALLYIDKNLPEEKVNLYIDSRFILHQERGKWNARAEHLIPFRNCCQSLYRGNPGVRLYYCRPEENKADPLTQEVFQGSG